MSISDPTPWTTPDVFDTITFARAFVWFGKFEIKGAERAYKWDIKDGLGIQGAWETFRGVTPPPFEITFYLWVPRHYVAWQKLSAFFRYNAAQLPPFGTSALGSSQSLRAVDVAHPYLASLGIHQVICEGIGAVQKESDDLLFSATLKLREFFPPIPISVQTPTDAKNETERTEEDPAVARRADELSRLSQTAAEAYK